MSFIYPEFLFALAAISVPILIHLFNFRRFKRVYFTNVRFLKEVKQETRSRSRLKHLLVLLSRILVLTFLVLAFAQPFIPAEDQPTTGNKRSVSVYLDNSFSMNGVNAEDRTLLEVGRQYAYEIGNAYAATDEFQLLTNAFEGRHQRLVNQEDFIELSDEVTSGPEVRNLSEVLSRQQNLLNESGEGKQTLFLISDFQRSITDLDTWSNDTNYAVRLIPLTPTATGNVYIDSCWFENPIRQLNKADELKVRLVNTSDRTLENVPIKLLLNGTQKSLASVTLAPQSTIDTALVYTANQSGIQDVEVVITDYPVTFDDHFYLSYPIASKSAVLHISGDTAADRIGPVFRPNDYFQYQLVGESGLNYASLDQNDLILISGLRSISSGLSQELNKFIDNGGSVLAFPCDRIELDSWNRFLTSLRADTYRPMDTAKTRVATIDQQHPLYEGVFESLDDRNLDMPVVLKQYGLTSEIKTNRETLLGLQNGSAFLSRYSFGKGQLYLCTVAPDDAYGNFWRHAFFLPTLYQMAFFAQSTPTPYYTIGEEATLELNRFSGVGDQPFHLESAGAELDLIPAHRSINGKPTIFLGNSSTGPGINSAGNYRLTYDNRELAGVAFNYARKESELSTYTATELKTALADRGLDQYAVIESDYSTLSNTLNTISQGRSFWEWCLVAALFFLLVEVALLRLWKN